MAATNEEVVTEQQLYKVVEVPESQNVRFECFNTNTAVDMFAQEFRQQKDYCDSFLNTIGNFINQMDNQLSNIDALPSTPRSAKKYGKLKRRAETPSSVVINKIMMGKENAGPNGNASSGNPKARKFLRAVANDHTNLSINQGSSSRTRVPRPKKIEFVSPKSSIPPIAAAGINNSSSSVGNNTRITRAQSKRNAAEQTAGNTFIAANSSVSTPQRGNRAPRQQQNGEANGSNSRLMTPILARQRKEEEEKRKQERLINSNEKTKRAELNKQAFLKNRQDSIRQQREKFQVTGEANKKEVVKTEEKRKVERVQALSKKLAAPRIAKPSALFSNKNNDSANQSNSKYRAGWMKQCESNKQMAAKALKKQAKSPPPPQDKEEDHEPIISVLSPIPTKKPINVVHELSSADKHGAPNSSFLVHNDNNNPAAFSHIFSPIIDPNRQQFADFKSPIIQPEVKTTAAANNATFTTTQPNTFSIFAAPSVASSSSITNITSTLPRTPTTAGKNVMAMSADISSYQMTPPPPPPPDCSNYDISGFVPSDDEEEHKVQRAGKKIPRWAQRANFLLALRAQFTMPRPQLQDLYNKAFQAYSPEVPVPVDEMDIIIRKEYQVRTSSVNWNHPKP